MCLMKRVWRPRDVAQHGDNAAGGGGGGWMGVNSGGGGVGK